MPSKPDISCILGDKYKFWWKDFKGELKNLIYHKNVLLTLQKSEILLEDKIYVIGPGPWLRPLCRDQERDFVQKSSADAIYLNINISSEFLQKSIEQLQYIWTKIYEVKRTLFKSPEHMQYIWTWIYAENFGKSL